MGIQDFEAMYDTIDLKRKGHITAEQIHKFCESLYYSPLCVQHVEGAIRDKCGGSGAVTRNKFLDVFVEIERRRATEEQAYWDFQALDYTASHRISLRDALLLFREVHGDQFSLTTWQHFLSSRVSPEDDISFDEIRFWLCSIPSGKPCSDKELKEEENKILMRQHDYAYNNYSNILAELDSDKERDNYEDDMSRHAQRKLNKWNSEGVKAMLFDDGLDETPVEARPKVKGQITVTHVTELIDLKYKTLQEKLMQEMSKNAAAMEDEQAEILREINRGLKNLLKQGQNFDGNIPGGRVMLPSSLTGLMGELHHDDRLHRKQVEDLKARLRSEGKTPREISLAVQELYEEIISGDSSCQAVLLQINRRHLQERDYVTSSLQSTRKNTADPILIEYCRLMRQLLIMEDEAGFVSIATAVGLVEREMEPRIDRFDWDRSRSERLAQFRLEAHKGLKPLHTPDTLPDPELLETGGVTELQVELIKEVTKKHFYEREAMIHLLQSNESVAQKSKARKMKPEERKHAIKTLQSQHKNWKSNPRADKSVLHTLLKEALWLRYEERRLELEIITPNVSEEEMYEVLLADLQQKQGLDSQSLIQIMHDKKQQDLILLLKKECKARLDENYENIVYVVLGTLEISADDEEHIKALEEKYDSLRKRIFFMALKEQHGSDWKEFSLEEKQSAMRELIKREKVLRSESKLTEMVDLIGPKGRLLPALHNLMGEEKGDYNRRQQQDVTGEVAELEKKAVNVLADLLPRCDNEQEYLLRWLQSPEAKGQTLRMRNMTLVELKVETLRVEMEEDFEIAAISVGLMERIADALTRRHMRDEDRQTQLSRKRVQLRQRRLIQMEEYSKDPEVEKHQIPKKGDITGLQVVYLHEMLKRHQDERELLLGHLQDDSTEDLIDAAKTMTDEDRQRRLAELQGKRLSLNFSNADDHEVNVSIIEEAAAIQTVCTMEQLNSQGQSTTMESVTVALLADLQDEQDNEIATALRAIENMDEEEIRKHLHEDTASRRVESATNVFTVLTRYTGEAQDEELIKALEAKYKVLREKLLVDSLVGRIGSDQWQALSYKEKQHKLAALDAQVNEQEKIGKVMPALLGDGVHMKEGLSQLMGVSLHVFRNKVKGQIEAGNHMNLHLEEYQGAVKKKKEAENPLKDIHQRMEEEKQELIKHLKGQTDEYFSEHDRQLQLLRYKRERKLANEEEGFVSAATLLGLLERQQEEVKFRLLKDKERYEVLAKQELLAIEHQKDRKMVDTMSSSKDFITLMEAIIDLLKSKHIQERQLFFKLLSEAEKYEDQRQVAALSSQQQRLAKLAELRMARRKSVEDKHVENLDILTQATVYKKEDRRSFIRTSRKDITSDELWISLMADLMEHQNSEAQRILKMLIKKSEADVSSYQNTIQQDRKANMADNVALVVFSPEKTDGSTESDLIEALKGKYDALKDKLLAEALMKELGESNWNRMSETERQRKIFSLKLKERQLRREGRFDEANELLGELLKEQEHLKHLMGESADEQRRKLQEKLKKRKQRQAAGMTLEEIDRLEKEEQEEEETREKNIRRNIMEDLEERFEQEKDELLKRIQNAGDDLDRERERQANLARLRRDERLARDEDRFGSAALILGLAEKQDKDFRLSKDEERKRQEKLARERIEAARQGRGQRKQSEGDNIVAVDTEDPASLQEAIARDLDKKHNKEMDFFMQLFKMLDDVSGSLLKKVADMSDEERDDKLFELTELHKNWLKSEDKLSQEQMDIFLEAAALQMELVKQKLEADGNLTSGDDIQVALVADLQEVQKQEAERLLDEIEDKDLAALKQLYKARTTVGHDDHHKNIAVVLLGDQKSQDEEMGGETTEATVLKALELKYDAIRDKLLIEALMKEHGEREWAEMSEKQRQRKLIDLKIKERQLRKEGKMYDIANIIGSHLENEKLLDELFGQSQKSQQERLNDRLARRRQLITERRAAGLSTDDTTINAIIEDEEIQEEKRKRRNILEDLQKNFDDEKAALLRTLARQTDKVAQERQRQIEIAKLKRDQRQLKKDEKLDVVAMMIQSAKQEDKKREEGILAERERQRAIAKQRLAARKQKKYQTTPGQEQTAEQLMETEETSKLEGIVKDAEGRCVQEALLMTVERRQEEEMDLLIALLEGAKTQQHVMMNALSKEDQELKSELTKLEHDQLRWRKKSKQSALALNEESLTEAQGRQHMTEVAQRRSDHLKLLTDAMVYRLEIERRMLLNQRPELQTDSDKLEEELMVAMVTDLQEKQTSETNAIQKLIEIQDEEILLEMKRGQHVACREGWFDNLTRTVFSLSTAEGAGEEIDKLEDNFREAVDALDQEFEREKEEALEIARRSAAEGEVINEEAIIRDLQEQYNNKKQKIMDDMNHQKEAMQQKLESRRLLKENRDYEDLAAKTILKLAKEQHSRTQENVKKDKGRQSSLLQQRLAQRREARKVAKQTRIERETTLDSFDKISSDESRFSTPIDLPFGGMRREKTVVDVDVTDEQKQAMYSQLMRQQQQAESKRAQQMMRQEEMLRRRLAARQGKQKDEAAELLSLGQRQKTVLEKTQKDEKDRQLQKIEEKRARMKEKRDPSPKVKGKH